MAKQFTISMVFNAVFDPALRGLKAIDKGMQEVHQSAERASASLGRMNTLLGGFGVAAAGGLLLVARNGLQAAAAIEELHLQYEIMLGSKKQADSMLADVVKLAATTPFELKEVANATKTLLAFGESERDVIALTRKLGEVTAVMKPAGGMDQTIRAYEQLKAGMWDSVQLSPLGVNKSMAERNGIVFDKSGAMVTEGKKAADIILKHWESQFGGLFERVSATWSGMTSNLKDNITRMFAAVGDALFPLVKPGLEKLNKLLSELPDDKNFLAGVRAAVKELWELVKPLVQAGELGLQKLVTLLKENPGALAQAARDLANGLRDLGAVIATLLTASAILGLVGALGNLGLAGILIGGPLVAVGLIALFRDFRGELIELQRAAGSEGGLSTYNGKLKTTLELLGTLGNQFNEIANAIDRAFGGSGGGGAIGLFNTVLEKVTGLLRQWGFAGESPVVTSSFGIDPATGKFGLLTGSAASSGTTRGPGSGPLGLNLPEADASSSGGSMPGISLPGVTSDASFFHDEAPRAFNDTPAAGSSLDAALLAESPTAARLALDITAGRRSNELTGAEALAIAAESPTFAARFKSGVQALLTGPSGSAAPVEGTIDGLGTMTLSSAGTWFGGETQGTGANLLQQLRTAIETLGGAVGSGLITADEATVELHTQLLYLADEAKKYGLDLSELAKQSDDFKMILNAPAFDEMRSAAASLADSLLANADRIDAENQQAAMEQASLDAAKTKLATAYEALAISQAQASGDDQYASFLQGKGLYGKAFAGRDALLAARKAGASPEELTKLETELVTATTALSSFGEQVKTSAPSLAKEVGAAVSALLASITATIQQMPAMPSGAFPLGAQQGMDLGYGIANYTSGITGNDTDGYCNGSQCGFSTREEAAAALGKGLTPVHGGAAGGKAAKPKPAAQSINQGGQMIGQVLNLVAQNIADGGKNLVGSLFQLAAQMAGPVAGPIIGGIGAIIGALSGKRKEKQQVEVVNEPTVHFARELGFGFALGPVGAAFRGALIASGAQFAPTVAVQINKGPGIEGFITATVTKHISATNFNQGRNRGGRR